MSFYQNVMPDRVVGATGASAPAGAGWTTVADFPTLVTNARSANLPLYLLGQTFVSGEINVLTTNGGGYPLSVYGVKGQTVIQYAGGAANLFNINGVGNVSFSNVYFNGANATITDTSNAAALINISGANATNYLFDGCTIYNSVAAGLSSWNSAAGTVRNSTIYSCSIGVAALDSNVTISNNNISYCNNNGVQIYASSATSGNLSIVSGNYISNISAKLGGTGPYGNGVAVWLAGGAKVLDNTIFTCAFTAIRVSGASNCQVIGNYCWNMQESAVYFECPGVGEVLYGGVFSNNIISNAGAGINCVNSGLANDGVSHKVTISNNQISNITQNNIPSENGLTYGTAIVAEGQCDVIGNTIDSCVTGIVLGTNNGAYDLSAHGNYVYNCKMGIGYSANAAATNILISGNLISKYTSNSTPGSAGYVYSGAIVSVSLAGSGATPGYLRDSPNGAANVDYGNVTQTTVGALTVGLNRAH